MLKQLNITYQWFDHPAVFTVAESDKLKGEIPGKGTKNIFLHNKRKENFYLISLCGDKQMDIKAFRSSLGESKLSFAKPQYLMQYLQVTPGSVNPYGLIYDTDKKVQFFIDDDLLQEEWISFHPNVNTATISLKTDDFQKYFSYTGHKIQTISL